MKNKHSDTLDEMTKDEIVQWLRAQFFARLPKRSEMLFTRWQIQSAAVLREQEKENRSLDHLDFAERDRLAAKFNESQDIEERMRLIEKIGAYDKAFTAHIDRCQKLAKKQERVDRLYEQIDVERKKEAQSHDE